MESASGQNLGAASLRTPAYLEFSDARYEVSELETNAVITIIRTGEYRVPASVEYGTEDGTAKAGEDYACSQGLLEIPAGTGSAVFNVPIRSGTVEGEAKTIQLRLFNPGLNVFITRENATLTITAAEERNEKLPLVLTVHCDEDGKAVVSWPAGAGRCLLEKAPDPGSALWVPVATEPQIINGRSVVREPLAEGQCFYRARVP